MKSSVRLLVLSTLFCVCTGTASAQRERNGPPRPTGTESHVDIPRDSLASDLAAFLKKSKDKPGFNPLKLKELRDALPSLNDPEALKRFLEQNPKLFDRDTIERFASLLKDYMDENPDDPKFNKIDPAKFADRWKDLVGKQPDINFPKIDPNDPRFQPRPQPNIVPPVNVERPRPNVMPKEPEVHPKAKQMGDWLKKHFGESDAVKNMVKDMSKAMKDGSNKGPSWLPDWKANGDGFGKWADKNMDFLKNVKLPEFKLGTSMRPPSFGSGGLNNFGSGGGSGGGSFSTGGGGDGWGSVLLFVLIGGVLVIVAIVLAKMRGSRAQDGEATARRPLTPVDPTTISTREQLVKAFEYLSLTKIGEAARVWNHRVIAGEMGGKVVPERDAAGAFAALYEHARYAPLNEEMSAEQFADARHQYRVLGGGTSA